MALERLQSGARRRVPEPYCAVVRCRRYRLAVRREGYSVNVTRVALERLQGGARRRVPEPYRRVVRCRRHRLAVRREGYSADVSVWPSSVCRAAPVAASQSRTVLSPDADATVLPSGEKATALT